MNSKTTNLTGEDFLKINEVSAEKIKISSYVINMRLLHCDEDKLFVVFSTAPTRSVLACQFLASLEKQSSLLAAVPFI